MNNILLDQFKPSDVEAAKREIVCIKDLMVEAQMDVDHGFYEGLVFRLENALRSAKQLMKMQQDNQQRKELAELLQQVNEQGRVKEMYRHFKGHEAI